MGHSFRLDICVIKLKETVLSSIAHFPHLLKYYNYIIIIIRNLRVSNHYFVLGNVELNWVCFSNGFRFGIVWILASWLRLRKDIFP